MLAPVDLDLRPSRLMAAYLSCLYAAALASLAPLSVPAWLKFVAILPLGWSALQALRKHAWRSAPDAVAALRLQADGSIELRRRGGETEAALVEPTSTLLPFVVVMHLRPVRGRGRCTVVLAPDALSGEQLRSLRVWLRWQADPSGRV